MYEFKCKRCFRIFKRKDYLKKHLERKNPCQKGDRLGCEMNINNPQTIQNNPQTIQNNPQTIQNNPQTIPNNPQIIPPK